MRWDQLFDDLEGQLEQELTAEEVDLRAEEERLRLGRLTIRDRIISIHESHSHREQYAIRLALADGQQVSVRPSAFGRDWFAADIVGEAVRRAQCIVPIPAIASLSLATEQVTPSLESPESTGGASVPARLGLAFVLRDLCRRRLTVELHTALGPVVGTIDRVGRDHLDLAVHERGEARRASAVSEIRVMPLAGLLLVRL
jgi:hypothetical protein